ncbi:MAG: phosphoribosylamine--glycine ligase, partial [Clostridia bacterium]|nr:phosphoribosylamine--glycine ligase [Clostridia bacterium]
LSAGGRVLGVTAIAPTLKEAIDSAYSKVSTIKFDNAFYRKDIGQKALKATEDK